MTNPSSSNNPFDPAAFLNAWQQQMQNAANGAPQQAYPHQGPSLSPEDLQRYYATYMQALQQAQQSQNFTQPATSSSSQSQQTSQTSSSSSSAIRPTESKEHRSWRVVNANEQTLRLSRRPNQYIVPSNAASSSASFAAPAPRIPDHQVYEYGKIVKAPNPFRGGALHAGKMVSEDTNADLLGQQGQRIMIDFSFDGGDHLGNPAVSVHIGDLRPNN